MLKIKRDLPEVGFEPTLANETELKSAALDHSAIQAIAIIKSKTQSGPTGTWTRIVGFKVQSDDQLHHKTNLDGNRTRNRWIRSPTRYPVAPQGLLTIGNRDR